MKKFIFRSVIFGIGLLGLAFFAEFVISKNLRKSTDIVFNGWNEIYSGNMQSNVVIMGSSRALYQYSPRILDSVLNINSYNLGIIGSWIDRQIVKYDTYRRFNKKPDYIIQNIDYTTINFSNGYIREQYFPYFFDDSLKTVMSNYEKFSFFEEHLPAYRYIGYTNLIKQALGIEKLFGYNSLIKGYLGLNQLWDGSELAKQTEINYSGDRLALLLFDKYLAKADSENIQVIFVYAPIYIGATEKMKNIKGMYQMYDSIARKYNIPILDYNYDPICYDTTYFYNAMHLNKTGAELFTTKLAHDIDSLGIIKGSHAQ